MGTPHTGGNKAAPAKLAADIVTKVTGQRKGDLMESLKKNSLLSAERQNYFRHQLEDYDIISFCETLGPKVAGRSMALVRLKLPSLQD